MHHPIQIKKDQLVRIYLVNMLEFDQINNFHLHANLYNVYRSGTNLVPDEYTDMITMSQGERSILEFKYKFPGQYMFHAHKTEFAEKGWMGLFLVMDERELDVGEAEEGNYNYNQATSNLTKTETTIKTTSNSLDRSTTTSATEASVSYRENALQQKGVV